MNFYENFRKSLKEAEGSLKDIYYFVVGICLDENRPDADEDEFYDEPEFNIPYKILDENYGVERELSEAYSYVMGYVKDGVPGTFGVIVKAKEPFEGFADGIEGGFNDSMDLYDVTHYKENGGEMIFCAYSTKDGSIKTVVNKSGKENKWVPTKDVLNKLYTLFKFVSNKENRKLFNGDGIDQELVELISKIGTDAYDYDSRDAFVNDLKFATNFVNQNKEYFHDGIAFEIVDMINDVIKAVLDSKLKESEGNGQVYVVCYNNLEVWDSRDDASDFYAMGVQCSDGAERDRYVNIFMDLMNGEPIAYDGDDEDFIMEIRFRGKGGKTIKKQKVEGRKTVNEVLADIKSGKALRESDEIKEVSKEEIGKIVEDWTSHREVPYGRFIANENGRFVAVDNRGGDCWTEEFPNKEDAMAWLNDEFEMSDYAERQVKESDEEYEKYMANEKALSEDYKKRLYGDIDDNVIAAFNRIKSAINTGDDKVEIGGFYYPQAAVDMVQGTGEGHHLNSYMDLTTSNILNMIDENKTAHDAIDQLFDEYKADSALSWGDNFITALKNTGIKAKRLKEDDEYQPNGVIDEIKKRGTGDTDIESPLELNTGVLPIVDVDCYSRQDMIYNPDRYANDDGSLDEDYGPSQETVDEAIMSYAPPVIEEYINKVLPGSKVTATEVYHPRQYNFGGDELEFKVDFDTNKYKEIEESAIRDGGFKEFLKKYSSYSGFYSYMADDIDEFMQQDFWKRFVQVVMFCLRNLEEDMEESSDSMWENIISNIG